MSAEDVMATSGDDVAKVPVYDAANPYAVIFPESLSVVISTAPLDTVDPGTIYPRP